MKNFIASLTLLLSLAVAHAQTEEQRKYIFADLNESTLRTVDGEAVINGLTIKKHSVYEYFDLYLDTAEFDLLKMNLSLRIRKRDYGNGTIEYGMQLKSEMLKTGDIRMELDETELDYMQVFYRGHVIKLQNVLAAIYENFQAKLATGEAVDLASDPDMQENLNILKTWLAFKANSAIAPLQKLRQLKLSLEKRQTLRPVILGRSVRTRSHVFIDRKNTTDDLREFAASTRPEIEIPAGVKSQDKVWTMEASFDRAQFYRVDAPGKHLINEFEVENKYLPHENSRELLSRFEDGLISELAAEVNLESKYLQTMKALGR